MNMLTKIALCLAPLAAASAADAPGVVIWKSGDLKAYQQKLAAKLSPQKVASEKINDFGNHYAMIAHREGTGEAEVHDMWTDLFVIETGEATLVIGGKLKNGKVTAPGEQRAASIDGGEKHKVSAGDVVHIPAKVAHHMLVDGGKQVTYFVIKVETK
ncbi:MAG: hypothetical protein ABI823_11340 [Bryobacteraceae bacterium]